MIYRNDNLTITDTYVIGTLKDLKEYFRYELASQCMSFSEDEDFLTNAADIINVISNLVEDEENGLYNLNDTLKVAEHQMGGFYITSEI